MNKVSIIIIITIIIIIIMMYLDLIARQLSLATYIVQIYF